MFPLDSYEDYASCHVQAVDCARATSLHLKPTPHHHNVHGGCFSSPVLVSLELHFYVWRDISFSLSLLHRHKHVFLSSLPFSSSPYHFPVFCEGAKYIYGTISVASFYKWNFMHFHMQNRKITAALFTAGLTKKNDSASCYITSFIFVAVIWQTE